MKSSFELFRIKNLTPIYLFYVTRKRQHDPPPALPPNNRLSVFVLLVNKTNLVFEDLSSSHFNLLTISGRLTSILKFSLSMIDIFFDTNRLHLSVREEINTSSRRKREDTSLWNDSRDPLLSFLFKRIYDSASTLQYSPNSCAEILGGINPYFR